jgi:hypothetical protein
MKNPNILLKKKLATLEYNASLKSKTQLHQHCLSTADINQMMTITKCAKDHSPNHHNASANSDIKISLYQSELGSNSSKNLLSVI